MSDQRSDDTPSEPCAHPSGSVVVADDGWHWCTSCDAETWVEPVFPPGITDGGSS